MHHVQRGGNTAADFLANMAMNRNNNEKPTQHLNNETRITLEQQVTHEEQIKRQIHSRRKTDSGVSHHSPHPHIEVPLAVDDDSQKLFNTTLTTLMLGNTGISDDAANQLSHVLAENHGLTYLDISSNQFTRNGNQLIAAGIMHNKWLRHLDYSENKVDEITGIKLLIALSSHPTIHTLLLQDCLDGSNGIATALTSLLRSTKTLQVLDISHCPLELPGVVDFYRSIGENTSLHTLEMSCMAIKSDQAVIILAKSIEAHTTLRSLNVSYNEITLRGCKALRDAATLRGGLHVHLEGNSGEKKVSGVLVTGGLLRQPYSKLK